MELTITPRQGWDHFGCLVCGAVFMLPATPDEEPPWCYHSSSNYRWKEPHSETIESGMATQTVRVKVTLDNA